MSRLILNQQLWQAACANDVAMVEAALVAGADPDFRDSPSDPTADDACFSTHSVLHEVAYRGHSQVAALLLSHGAEQCKDGTYGLTPLHLACLGGHLDTAVSLLARGADANARCDGGDSVMMTALMGENPYSQHVPWLYQKMDNPEAVKALVDLLVKSGTDINGPNEAGETPLWNVIRYHDADMLQHMVSKGADIHHKNVFGDDLIAEAAQSMARADGWGEIPHRRKEGLSMRKRVLECIETMHQNGLQWTEVSDEELLQRFPSEAMHQQLQALWSSMSGKGSVQAARAATP